MSEMVDRLSGIIEGCCDVTPSTATVVARAVVAAMHEPTEFMLRVGGDVLQYDERRIGEFAADAVYKTMIDEALK